MYIASINKKGNNYINHEEKKGLFDEEFTKDRLSTIGNPLEKISKVVDFELFKELLEKSYSRLTKRAMQEQNLMRW